MNLRDRLEQIESLKKKVQQISNNRNQKNTFSKKSNNKSSVSEIVPGNTIETPHGNCFYAERIITPDTSFGENSLSDIQRYFTPDCIFGCRNLIGEAKVQIRRDALF